MIGVSVGPFAFDATRLAAVAGIVAFLIATEVAARRGHPGVNRWGFRALLGWIIGARAGFVAAHAGDFAAAPLEALMLWQGGFSASAGWLAAAAVLALAAWRGPRGTVLPLIMAGALAGAVHLAALAAVPRPAGQMPVTQLLTLEGRPEQLAGRDRVVVLNLWATWCPPCRREMPMMTELAAQMPDTDFVFANQGEDAARIEAFLAAAGLPRTGMLRDPAMRLMTEMNAAGLPATLIFDARGALVATHMGEISRPALRQMIQNAKD